MTAPEIAVRQAAPEDAATVATLVFELLLELVPSYAGTLTVDELMPVAAALLGDDDVWAYLAETRDGRAIGVLTLNECAAIYARGRFGEISELYVRPDQRSAGVAPKLLDAAAAFGRARGWRMIEVGAPDLPRWQRTVDFYKRYGFTEIGPRLAFDL